MKQKMTKKFHKDPVNWRGLQVVEKKVYGITVGFIVGWWTYARSWHVDRQSTFRNFREGVVWPTKEAAIAFRDSVEARRKDRPLVVEFLRVDD